jgi:hypothetical protein
MDPALKAALSQPDIDDTLISAVEHADLTIRRYIWHGFKPKSSMAKAELMVDGKTAGDFVNEALRRLCEGIRTYDSARTLLQNLNSVTDSIIWSDKKASDLTGVVDFPPKPAGADSLPDPIESALGKNPTPLETLTIDELSIAQTKCFDMIRASFDGDAEMQEYIDTLSLGFHKPEEISDLTGIPIQDIYELRRKLKKHAKRLFNATNFSDLKRKLESPENESEAKPAN